MQHLGRMLGSGGHRDVYEFKVDPAVVVKVAKSNRKITSNRQEWDAWQTLKDTDEAQFLVPCIAIADDNKWMLQAKALPTDRCFAGQEVRPWMNDMAPKNCGIYNGRLVAVDYGSDKTSWMLKKWVTKNK